MASTERPSDLKDDVDTIEIQKFTEGANKDGDVKKSELDNLGIWATVKTFKKVQVAMLPWIGHDLIFVRQSCCAICFVSQRRQMDISIH